MDNLLPWFCLKNVPGIGNHLFKRLIDRFHSPEYVFQASRQQLLEVEGLSERHLEAIRNYKATPGLKSEVDRVNQKGYRIITLTDPLYPLLLKEIPDPPPYLYVYGDLDASPQNIAVVGSRHPTAYGVSITEKLCADLCALGITIVSGMAVGIDTAAHRGALSGKGKTVAVLGSGFNKIYPAQNMPLFEQIAVQGAIISEFALDAEPEAHHFPIRNRIISGMSMGTVVVEATRRSGSLITARLAAEQNREVFAVPGSIQSFKSTGTHALIKQGAKLVENAQDVLEELDAYLDISDISADRARNDAIPKPSTLTPEERGVYNMISPYPEHIDTIGRKAHIEPGTLLSLLLQLELKGMVQQLPGKYFARFEHKEKR
jgi:DNA processing protein